MQVKEDLEIAIRLDVSTSATVLPTNAVPPSADPNSAGLEAIAISTQKAIAFEAITRCLWSIGETEQHPSVASLLSFSLENSFTELPDHQDNFLAQLGFRRRYDDSYEISLPNLGLTVLIAFERQEIERGSIYRKTRTRILITSKDTKDVVKAVLATLIGSALASCAISPEPMDFAYSLRTQPIYICTINASMQGNNEEIVREAAEMLSTTEFRSKEHEMEVWKARQMCLAAAGFDPGPIDGIPGDRTMKAAESYSAAFDNVQILWSSSVFARHLIYHSFVRHELLRQMK
ncbi:peptidoglycan-binding domain-containing protein [Paracoccus litorisediminis]|uniref:Peptidoglycan binding domain-containing protein n=1 Tax=Paracoccus litorisediminis TaxID=2006130 RepID=A0A844HNI5_9RHOB|nr:hypothetical protein [Paracoccus litorisediminis]MTH60649.1 hypothetical protein [Paracoccus litorisediminis]